MRFIHTKFKWLQYVACELINSVFISVFGFLFSWVIVSKYVGFIKVSLCLPCFHEIMIWSFVLLFLVLSRNPKHLRVFQFLPLVT